MKIVLTPTISVDIPERKMKKGMKKFEVCIVSKEYRYVEIEAEDDIRAIELAWDKVACGYTGDVKSDDSETEVYLEGELEKEEEAK